MKRIAFCCTLSLLILLLLAGCAETKQKTSTDAAVITHVTTTPEMTAAPTPRNDDADSVIPTPTPRNDDANSVIPAPTPQNDHADNLIPTPTPRNDDANSVMPTLTPSIFDVDDVNMRSTPESSCFSEIGYDSDWEVLVVRFRDSGSVYTYSDFPEGEWIEFIAADSLGRWYNAHIKGRYEYEEING